MKPLYAFWLACILCATSALAQDELTGNEASHDEMHSTSLYQGEQNQSEGFYSSGKLSEGSTLPIEGLGFVKIHRPRGRWFASFDMVEILKNTAAQMQGIFPSADRVQVGDMAGEGGGLLSGHASHQNGLDADVAFIRLNRTEQDPNDTSGFVESFVNKGRLTNNYDLQRNWNFAKLLVATGRVQRLFVNAVVKKGLCAYVKSTGEQEAERETLTRLRTIAGHTDHFHVRITCPLMSPNCKPQDEVTNETGCPGVK